MSMDHFKFHHLVERNTLSHSLMILVATPRYSFYDKRMGFFPTSMKFKFVVETIIGRKIKSFQSDQSGEFLSKEF